jgi:hypothetical protein
LLTADLWRLTPEKSMSATALILSLLAGTAAAEARDEAPAADVAKARALIKQLGDAKFKVRDSAEKELVHLGLASLEALKEGEKNSDLHIQERCRQLQPMIRALTLQKRIDNFLAHRDGPLPKNLPFVVSFMAITGDSKEARQLYAEVLQINPQLLDDAERDQKKGLDQFAAYCQEVNQRTTYRPGVNYEAQRRLVTRADVALYFLLSSEFKNDPTNRVANFGYSFLNAPSIPETLGKDDPAAQPFKKLFLSWVEKQAQPYLVQRGLQIAAEAKMKETLPLVLKQIKEKNVPIYTRAQTALLLVKVGNKEHVKEVEPLLEDKTIVGTFGINNKQGQVQMRDVALAICIKLSGQKMSEYDFDVMKGNDDFIYQSYIYCAFSGDDKREAAHKKYKELKDKTDKEKVEKEKVEKEKK